MVVDAAGLEGKAMAASAEALPITLPVFHSLSALLRGNAAANQLGRVGGWTLPTSVGGPGWPDRL